MHQDQRTLHGIRLSTVEIFESVTPINIGNIDYYSTVTIKALLKILIDPTLKNNHSLAIEAIGYIIKMLGTKCGNFLNLIIPAFVDIISISRHKFKSNLLHQLEKIIIKCGTELDANYLDSILDIIISNCRQKFLTTKCLDTLISLIKYNKNELRHKLEPLLIAINRVFYMELDKQNYKKVFEIYELLQEKLNYHLHIIIPELCSLLISDIHIKQRGFLVDTIKILETISEYCSSVS